MVTANAKRQRILSLADKKKFVSPEFHRKLNKSKVRAGNILIARSGSFGVVSIHMDSEEINSADIIIIEPLLTEVNPYYLLAFLNCTYGVGQLLRFANGGLQGHVNLTILENLRIPLVSHKAQAKFEGMITNSYSARQTADHLYAQAETTLLSELGLVGWQPKSQLSFTRDFSDLKQADRVDAEYFQPKYDELIAYLKDYPGGWATLGDCGSIRDTNYTPLNAMEYKYIELANIAANGEIVDCTVASGEHLPGRARRKVSVGDVIVSSIEGSLESTALISSEYDQAICSTGFHVINPTSVNSEILRVLLKSIVGYLQLKRGCSGTILTAVNRDTISQLVLSLVSKETQREIRQLVIESAALRQQSRALLECAKRAVEMSIEQDEHAATVWLDHEASLPD